jgi:predicted nucleic acid-binding protein
MLLLDTNVISELRKLHDPKTDRNLVAWNNSVDPIETYLSVVVLHELEIGVGLIERKDPTGGAALRHWLETMVIPAFRGRVLPLDAEAAAVAARWHVTRIRPINDAYIAATAATRGLTVVTRNEADFEGFGVPVVNPWKFGIG